MTDTTRRERVDRAGAMAMAVGLRDYATTIIDRAQTVDNPADWVASEFETLATALRSNAVALRRDAAERRVPSAAEVNAQPYLAHARRVGLETERFGDGIDAGPDGSEPTTTWGDIYKRQFDERVESARVMGAVCGWRVIVEETSP